MTIRQVAVAAISIIVLGAVFGAAFLLFRDGLAPGIETYRTGLAEQARELVGQPESVSDGAVYQRFRARRAAVASMKADLLRLVAAESALVADSGFPRAQLGAPYWTGPSRGNVGPWIHLTPNGWWATLSSSVTAIQCAVAVGGDTTFGTAGPGEPWCFGENEWRGAQQ
jgi:hypothetical protein